MPVTLKLASPKERTVPITLGDAGTIELVLRPPALGEELSSIIDANPLARRMEQSIVGWKGANDEHGKPIPYSHDALAEVLRQFPRALGEVLVAVMDVPVKASESDAKNSAPLSSESCGTADTGN